MSDSPATSTSTSSSTPAAEPVVPRRRFLELASVCAGACTGAAALGAVAVVVVGPTLGAAAASDAWLDAGALEAFREGVAVKVALEGEMVDAWRRRARVPLGSVIVTRRGERVEAMSAVCPHNGCDVLVDAKGLLCPCHDSRFGPQGDVLTGPSPRGLDPLEVSVEAARVRVRLRRFAVATAERRPL